MTALLIGYARCSTDQQDLTAQRQGLVALGVADKRIYVDHGLTGLFGVARSTVYRAVERERTRNVMGVGTTVG